MLRSSTLAFAALGATTGGALALEAVSFGTNWEAQAEHGGFYQSVADGTYAECGLDVTIVPGGPLVNNRALMLAGRMDFHMGGNMQQAFDAVDQDIPLVVVAASFQKSPQVIISHPGVADTWEELQELDTLLIGDGGYISFYQWMMSAFDFTEEQRAPYTFSIAPFLANENIGMQGFLSSEPFAIQQEAGFEPNVFVLADYGFGGYATTIETMASTIEERPEVVECFVNGSILGWYNFLYGDNSAAVEMILADNDEMTLDKIDFAINAMISEGIVDSGDALEYGIGVITEEAVGAFYADMVAAGVMEEGVDWRASFTTEFVGNGLGMDLRPAE